MKIPDFRADTGVFGEPSPSVAANTFAFGPFVALVAGPASATTFRYYLGVIDEPGMYLSKGWAVASATLARSASAYYTFKVFIYNPDGTIRIIGTPRGTNSYTLTLNRPFKCHDEDNLAFRLPRGSVVGIQIDVTGAPSAPARILLQVSVYRGS